MRHEQIGEPRVDHHPCRYGNSKIFFRGPRRSLKERYVTFLGGTETYGKYVETPFPEQVEMATGISCVNLGCVNASVDAFLPETSIHEICKKSALNVLQIMGAHNMSNRFYTVHPRRNDRFVKASSVMRAIYPEVDFTEFCFTRHMLAALYDISPERFEIIMSELQMAWRARMKTFLTMIGGHTLLLWYSTTLPSDASLEDRSDPINFDPLFVTRSMVDELRQQAHGVIIVQPPQNRLRQRERPEISPLLDQAAHDVAGTTLTDAVRHTLNLT